MGKISILVFIIFLTQCIVSSSSYEDNGNGSDSVKGKETFGSIIGGVPFPFFPFFHPPPPPMCNDCFTPPPEPNCAPPPPSPPPPKQCPPPPPPSPPPPKPSPPPPPPPSPPPPKPVPSPPPPKPKPSPPPPKPKPSPPPPPRVSPELQKAIKTIQKFKKLISYDPTNITSTWVGDKICIDPSTYKGFTCAKIPGDGRERIAGVTLNGANLDSNSKSKLTLDGFINGFEDLVFYHVNSNNFTGDIPIDITKLVYFYELDLSNNKLEGAFPKAVLGAQNLTFLDLRFNFLTGLLPPEVFNLDLDVLFLNNNQFTGNIPDNLGNTPALYLTLAKNQFTGTIPKSIGQAKDTLVEILLLGNKLSGCLPYEIGLLKLARVIDASENKLTGPIPKSFGCLSRIERLNFSSNELFGMIPESLCQLSSLYNLCLQENYFTQVGPECRKLIKSKVLNVKNNCISDLRNQKSKAECAAFFSKTRTCPDQQSMTYVPCAVTDSKEKVEEERLPLSVPSPSYAALEKPGS